MWPKQWSLVNTHKMIPLQAQVNHSCFLMPVISSELQRLVPITSTAQLHNTILHMLTNTGWIKPLVKDKSKQERKTPDSAGFDFRSTPEIILWNTCVKSSYFISFPCLTSYLPQRTWYHPSQAFLSTHSQTKWKAELGINWLKFKPKSKITVVLVENLISKAADC